jgi:hypothetical protein
MAVMVEGMIGDFHLPKFQRPSEALNFAYCYIKLKTFTFPHSLFLSLSLCLSISLSYASGYLMSGILERALYTESNECFSYT